MACSGPNPCQSIVTSSQTFPGTLYAPGDTGNINQNDGNPAGETLAVYVVDTVDGGGGVLTYHLSASGCAYQTSLSVTTTPLTGSGDGVFTVSIDSVGACSGSGSGYVNLVFGGGSKQ